MRRLLLLVAVGGLALVPAATGSSTTERVSDTPARLTPPNALIDFSLLLRQRDGAIDRYMRGLFDSSSPLYGHYLKPDDFGRRFGISRQALLTLERGLRASGLRVTETFPQRTSLQLRGTAATIRQVFGTPLLDLRTAKGVRFHAPATRPTVPASLSRWVLAVDGLNTRPLETTHALPHGAITPVDLEDSYQIKALHDSATKGDGQTIAVLSIDHFSQAHVDMFARKFGLPLKPAVKRMKQIGKPDFDSVDETDMDIEIIRGVAPNAQVIDYPIAFNNLARAINTIVKDGNARIVTGSFGACDSTKADQGYKNVDLWKDPAFRRGIGAALRAAAAAGFSFFFSTGDDGSTACAHFDPHDLNATVSFPSSAPYAIAVGGTVLTYDNKTWYETGWNGSGGGLNPYDARPPWQASTDIAAGGASAKRRVPDVSAAAQDWAVYTTSVDSETGKKFTGWATSGGTSASSPFWAASMLLVQQWMKAQGAGPVCFAAPLLYGIAAGSWRFPPFFDVKSGTNGGNDAGAGWDFVTGLGTPYLWNLAGAAVLYRKAHPLPGGGNACASFQA